MSHFLMRISLINILRKKLEKISVIGFAELKVSISPAGCVAMLTHPVREPAILSVLDLSADLLHQLLHLVVAEVDAVFLQHLLDA